MTGISVTSFNLIWNQHDQYWLRVYPKAGHFSEVAETALKQAGLQKKDELSAVAQTGRDWKATWDKLYAALEKARALDDVEVTLSPGNEASAERKTAAAVQAIAQSLWLGDALLEDRIMCYLQPVLSARDKIFGYESFVRARAADGSIVAGDKIVAASKALGIEYMIDRHLHVQAIRTFVSSAFNGFLFVNFFPGFIHRPAVYLEGLSETAKGLGIVAKHIVLDFTKSETPRDITHMKNVCEYGRSRGYSIALDDVVSVDNARKLLSEIHPDFLKIDMKLVRRATESAARQTIRQIVDMAHEARVTVIGEGVETEEVHQVLRQLGVDLFQGYLFSPPVPVEAVLQRGTGTV